MGQIDLFAIEIELFAKVLRNYAQKNVDVIHISDVPSWPKIAIDKLTYH